MVASVNTKATAAPIPMAVSNVDCTLTIFRNKCDKQLSDKQIVELVTKRKTGLITGFKGKNGKAFDASLVLDEQFNVGFSFPEKKAKPKK